MSNDKLKTEVHGHMTKIDQFHIQKGFIFNNLAPSSQQWINAISIVSIFIRFVTIFVAFFLS